MKAVREKQKLWENVETLYSTFPLITESSLHARKRRLLLFLGAATEVSVGAPRKKEEAAFLASGSGRGKQNSLPRGAPAQTNSSRPEGSPSPEWNNLRGWRRSRPQYSGRARWRRRSDEARRSSTRHCLCWSYRHRVALQAAMQRMLAPRPQPQRETSTCVQSRASPTSCLRCYRPRHRSTPTHLLSCGLRLQRMGKPQCRCASTALFALSPSPSCLSSQGQTAWQLLGLQAHNSLTSTSFANAQSIRIRVFVCRCLKLILRREH